MSDPNMIMNFANNQPQLLTGIGQGLRGLGGQIVNQIQGKRANAAYTEALDNYSQDTMNEENRLALMQASQGVGKFDDTLKVIENMGALEQKNQLNTMGKNYSAVLSGNTQIAIDDLEAQALANENDGDDTNNGEAKELRFFAQQLRDGKTKEFLTHHGSMIGLFDGGTEVMGNIRDQNADRIATGEYGMKVMETGANLEKDGDTLNSMIEAAKNDSQFGEINLAALNYAKALEGGMELDPTEFNKNIFSLRNEFQKKSKEFMDYQGAAGTLSDILDSVEKESDPDAIGLIDISAINLFQRGIDPATVREGDVALIQSAKSLAERLLLVKESLTKGSVLTPEQRQEMRDISQQLVVAKKAYVDEVVYPSINATHSRLDPEGSTRAEVFSGYTPLDEQAAADKIVEQKEEVAGRLDNLRAFARERNPNSTGKIEDMTEAQIKAAYPGTYSGFEDQSEETTETIQVDY